MKKITELFLTTAIMIFALPTFVMAETSDVTFYDNETKSEISGYVENSEIFAEVTFVAESESATVIAAQYNNDGSLSEIEFIENLTVTAGETVTYTTPVISVDTGAVKVFAWDGLNSLKPLLEKTGVINNSVVKFD